MRAALASATSLLALLLLGGRGQATPTLDLLAPAAEWRDPLDGFPTMWATLASLGAAAAPRTMPMTSRLFSGGVGLDHIDEGMPQTKGALGTVADAIPRRTGGMTPRPAAVFASRPADAGSPSVFVGTGSTFSVADTLDKDQPAASRTFSYSYAPAPRRFGRPGSRADEARLRPADKPAGAGGPTASSARRPGPPTPAPAGQSGAALNYAYAPFSRPPAGEIPRPVGAAAGVPRSGAMLPGNGGPVSAPTGLHERSSVFVGLDGAFAGVGPTSETYKDALRAKSLVFLLFRTDLTSMSDRATPADIFPLSAHNPFDAAPVDARSPDLGSYSDTADAQPEAPAVQVPLVVLPDSDEMLDPTVSIYLFRPTGLNGFGTRLRLTQEWLASLSGPEIVSFGVTGIALAGLADLWRRRRRAKALSPD